MPFDWGSVLSSALPSLISAGGSALGNIYKDTRPSGDTQLITQEKASEAAQANELAKERLSQEMAIAQMDAAARGAAARATMQAAAIAANAQNKATSQRGYADLLTGQIERAKLHRPDVVSQTGHNAAADALQGGANAVDAYDRLVARLQNPLLSSAHYGR